MPALLPVNFAFMNSPCSVTVPVHPNASAEDFIKAYATLDALHSWLLCSDWCRRERY